jgi:hypothetical protein
MENIGLKVGDRVVVLHDGEPGKVVFLSSYGGWTTLTVKADIGGCGTWVLNGPDAIADVVRKVPAETGCIANA